MILAGTKPCRFASALERLDCDAPVLPTVPCRRMTIVRHASRAFRTQVKASIGSSDQTVHPGIVKSDLVDSQTQSRPDGPWRDRWSCCRPAPRQIGRNRHQTDNCHGQAHCAGYGQRHDASCKDQSPVIGPIPVVGLSVTDSGGSAGGPGLFVRSVLPRPRHSASPATNLYVSSRISGHSLCGFVTRIDDVTMIAM